MIHSQKITTSSCSAAASAAVAVTEMDVGFVDRAAVEILFLFFKEPFQIYWCHWFFMTGVYFQIHNFD